MDFKIKTKQNLMTLIAKKSSIIEIDLLKLEIWIRSPEIHNIHEFKFGKKTKTKISPNKNSKPIRRQWTIHFPPPNLDGRTFPFQLVLAINMLYLRMLIIKKSTDSMDGNYEFGGGKYEFSNEYGLPPSKPQV